MSTYTMSIGTDWHARSPKITASGSITFTRSSEADNRISFSGSFTNTIQNASRCLLWNGLYG